MGQLVEPPETAISVPMQQAISQLQGGPMALARPVGQTEGLQTREQLGLPPRRSYLTFVPTAEEVAGLGAVPPIRAAPATGKTQRLRARAEAAKAKGKPGKAARLEAEYQRRRRRSPELPA
jgi:hypothetical protein